MARHRPYLQATSLGGPAPDEGTRRRTLFIGIPVVGLAIAVLLIAGSSPAGLGSRATERPLDAAARPLDAAAPSLRLPTPDPVTALAGDPTDPPASPEQDASPSTEPAPTPTDAAPAPSASSCPVPAQASASPTAAPSVVPSPSDVAAPSLDPDLLACSGPLPDPSTGPSPEPSGTGSLEPEELTGYRWPLYQGRITSFFAPRDSGFLVVDHKRIHQGLDVSTYCGDEVKAAHAGTVVAEGRHFQGKMGFDGATLEFRDRVERRGTWGLLPIVVIIDDGNGYYSSYVHLSATAVRVGQHVRGGDVIGYEGDTGNATGCHLHYELARMDGPWMKVANEFVEEYLYPRRMRERIDPLRVLDLRSKRAPAFVPGIEPPRVSPGLGRSTVPRRYR